MKRKILLVALLHINVFTLSARRHPSGNEKPKLVVGIVVDQMRWDYLYRFTNHYGNGGFKRMMNNGFACQNTMINYLPSFTAPGHACIYTGSVPAIHGIAANDWIDNITGEKMYCVEDRSVNDVNGNTIGGKSMSPRNLLSSTVTDELRLATNFRSKVFGVAIKDRGSILPAGHLANGAFWLDDSAGNFITSTYYKHTNPAWLAQFNRRHLVDSLTGSSWKTIGDANDYTESTNDENIYEGRFKSDSGTSFPHRLNLLKGKSKLSAFKATPGGNELTLQAAIACMEGEHMGAGSETDFLCVSLSSTDYTGHQFGPNSMEIEDVYWQLDGQIARFLTKLDKTIGKGNYVVFLTADHGAAHNPQFLKDNGVPAGFLDHGIKKELNQYLSGIYHVAPVAHFTNYQVYLNDSAINATGADRKKIRASIVDWFNKKPEISFVADLEQMGSAAIPEPLKTMMINGYNAKRSGCIQVIPNSGWFEGYGVTGTTHGTWNPYDAHIPLLWYGWHIPNGTTTEITNMTDIAATLAALLHIQMPNGCIGRPITAITENK